MPKQILVEIEPPQQRNGQIRIAARISGFPGWRRMHPRNGTLFFDVPEAWSHALAIQGDSDDVHDMFARAAIFTAMEARRPLVVRGNISRSLIENLDHYQRVIHGWWPRYWPVEIRADAEITAPAQDALTNRDQALLPFSGGMDSCYSLYTHKRQLLGSSSQSIGAGLFLRGYDMQFTDDGFSSALARVTRMADSMDLPLIQVSTNIRSRMPSWINTCGTALVTCLSLFQRRFSAAILPPHYEAEESQPNVGANRLGDTPWSNPYLASDEFQIIDDPLESRTEKCKVLHDWKIARENIRVCFRDQPLNCGECEKCLRQMFAMKLAGIDDFSAFANQFDHTRLKAADIRRVPIVSSFWKHLVEEAKKSESIDETELNTVKAQLARAIAPRRLRRRLRSIATALFDRYVY